MTDCVNPGLVILFFIFGMLTGKILMWILKRETR